MTVHAYRSKTGAKETQFIGLRTVIGGALEMVNLNAIVRILESTECSYHGVADDEPAICRCVITVLFNDGKRGTYDGEILEVAGALGIHLKN